MNLNNGDTAFVLPASAADHDIGVRFFTPRKEAPFVGHATLAAHAVLAQSLPQALRRQKGRTGIVEVQALPDGGFSIRQSAPPLGRTLASAELEQVLSLLGLAREQLDADCPARIAGTASTRLLLGVREAQALDAMQPQLAALGALSPQLGAQGYFVFTRSSRVQGCATEARMFCPALGIDEDPVSGNAHAMLGVCTWSSMRCCGADGAVARFIGAPGHACRAAWARGGCCGTGCRGKPAASSHRRSGRGGVQSRTQTLTSFAAYSRAFHR